MICSSTLSYFKDSVEELLSLHVDKYITYYVKLLLKIVDKIFSPLHRVIKGAL